MTGPRPADPPPVRKLVRSADFERVLGAPSRARSTHFAVHHLASAPSRPRPSKLSTDHAPVAGKPVDNSLAEAGSLWLGTVVPKRLARRAVTRNLVKRQMRAAVLRHASQLPRGLWVLRLRSAFGTDRFPSAASTALQSALREELESVLQRAAAR
jgi:ribonuclease P protein component